MGFAPSIERPLHDLRERYRFLREEEGRFLDHSNRYVRWVSDSYSGANRYQEVSQFSLESARQTLEQASEELRRGNLDQTAGLLKTADRQLSLAQDFWRKQTGKSAEGAETAIVVDTGAAVLVTLAFVGGALATAVGVSIGIHLLLILGISTLLKKEPPSNSRQEIDGFSTEPESDPEVESPPPPTPEEMLESQIERAVSQPSRLEQPVKFDLQALITEAQQALTEWKLDPTVQHDIGDFLIRSEIATSREPISLGEYQGILERRDTDTRRHQEIVRRTKGNGPRAFQLIKRDNKRHYRSNYSRANALLIDLYRDLDGNCHNGTMIDSCATIAATAPFPYPFILAIYRIEDKLHSEAVVYNRETGYLEPGHRRPLWPLYDPHLFYLAFLRKQSASSPVTEEDLMIPLKDGVPLASPRSGVGEEGGDPYPTDSNLRFRRTGHATLKEDLPLYAYDDPSGKTGRDALFEGDLPRATSLEDLDAPRAEKIASEMVFNDFESDFTVDTDLGLVFRTRLQWREYQRARKREGKSEVLFGHFNDRLSQHTHSPRLDTLYQLLKDPRSVVGSPLERLTAARQAYEDLGNWRSEAVWQLAGLYPIPGTEGLDQEGREPKMRHFLEAHHPDLVDLQRKVRGLMHRIEEHPAEFILFLDRLEEERRDLFLWTLATIEPPDLPMKHAFIRALKEPGLIEPIDRKKKDEEKFPSIDLPPVSMEALVPFDLTTGGIKLTLVEPEPPKEIQSHFRISRAFFAQLVSMLAFTDPTVARRRH